MSMYRKKPVVIEARRIVDTATRDSIMEWCDGSRPHEAFPEVALIIPTLEGEMSAAWGDYIIKGVTGEFYPCKPDIFHATYEAINGVPQ